MGLVVGREVSVGEWCENLALTKMSRRLGFLLWPHTNSVWARGVVVREASKGWLFSSMFWSNLKKNTLHYFVVVPTDQNY